VAHRAIGAPRRALWSRTTLRGLGGLRRVLLSDLLMAFAWNANGLLVPLVGRRHGWSADTVGNLVGAFGVAVLCVRLLPAPWRTRGSDWRTITRALLVSGATLALLPFVTAMPMPYLLEALFGCGLGSSLPSVLALVEAATPAGRRAEVLGLRQAVLGLGAATLPAALGTLVTAVSLGPATVGFGAALLGAGAVIAPRGRRTAVIDPDRRTRRPSKPAQMR
jgi:predicted MFS family arabinose efflux permease